MYIYLIQLCIATKAGQRIMNALQKQHNHLRIEMKDNILHAEILLAI